jgi:hypothetical protein
VANAVILLIGDDSARAVKDVTIPFAKEWNSFVQVDLANIKEECKKSLHVLKLA